MGLLVRRVAAATLLSASVLHPAAAEAAPVPDRVVAAVARPLDVAIDGRTVAWLHLPGAGRAAELVIHDGRRVVRRIAAGRAGEGVVDNGPGAVDVGRDARGRAVVAYSQCASVEGSACDVRVVRVAGGPPERVARTEGMTADVALGGGRVAWIDPDSEGQVRSRVLSGGPVRLVADLSDGSLTDLAVAGGRIVASGYTSAQPDGSNSDYEYTYLLAEAGPGSARLRPLRSGGSLGFDSPAITRRGITVLDSPRAFADLSGGRRKLRATGMPTLGWDAAGDRAVLVEGAPVRGETCGLELVDVIENPLKLTEAEQKALEGKEDVPTPCRIVVSANHRAERLLPPVVTRVGRRATITRAVLSNGRVVRREPVRRSGVTVTVRDIDGAVVASPKTDAGGRVTLPPATRKRPNLLSATPGVARTYAVDDGR